MTVRAALDLAAAGIPAFPCGQDKRPLLRDWQLLATTDEPQLRAWWSEWPAAMVGVPTGETSGIFVLDVDVDRDTGERVGEASLAALGFRRLLDGPGVTTPSGGRHLYFRDPGPEFTISAGRLGFKLDTRGSGGFAIGPGSLNGAGCYAASDGFRWHDLPEVPSALLEALRKQPKPARSAAFDEAGPAEVGEALTYVDPDLGYGDWVSVLMAVHDQFGDAGLQIADTWSARGAKYQPGEVARKWASFTSGGGASIATVFALARTHGCDLGALARKHRHEPPRKPNGHNHPRATGGTAGPHRERPDMDGRADTAERPFAPRDEDLGDIEPTEHGVAAAFTARYAAQFRFDYDIGKWFEWTGDHWHQDGSGRAFHQCCELARVASVGPKPSASVRRASFAAGVERIARAHPAHIIGQSEWDADPWLLGCPTVTIDLRTGAAVAPDPAHLITKIAACAPAERAECPRWLAFLAEATGVDAGLVRFLQQWTGYCLTGDTREHALIFLYGDGGTGKGTFMRTIAALAGGYGATAAMETFTASKFERHPTDLAALRGARLVTASETEKGRAWADTRIKALTGGDPVKARFMRQDEFTYQPQLKLIIVGNHRPVLNDVDDAMRRRLNMVLFSKKPAQADDQLEEKLRPEWPAILRWMLDGCLDWQRNGLVRPKSVLDATAEYFDAQDAVGQWLEEHCTVDRGNLHRWETARDLFEDWRVFAKAAGEDAGSAKGLGDVLSRRGFVRDTKRVQGKTPKVWCGLTLKRPGGEP